MMRSEVAWAAASRRAASLFGLPAPESSTSLGVEDLRLFSKGVQVVTPSQQAEFFSSPADETGRDEEVAAATFAAPLPSASFIPFNAAGLQCALAEACLFGWQLWGAEAAASAGCRLLWEMLTAPDAGGAAAGAKVKYTDHWLSAGDVALLEAALGKVDDGLRQNRAAIQKLQ